MHARRRPTSWLALANAGEATIDLRQLLLLFMYVGWVDFELDRSRIIVLSF